MQILLLLCLIPVVAPISIVLSLRVIVRIRKRREKRSSGGPTIGFLHPHSLSGGGGERVLWCALLATSKTLPTSAVTVYSAWEKSEDAVARAHEKVKTQFGLDITSLTFQAVDITSASKLVEPTNYPRLTLLLQSLGMILLGGIAYYKHPVDVMIDTANQTFALILPKLLGARTMSYVHYPTISSDMLAVVESRRAGVNNASDIASSRWRTKAKLLYYRAFARFYQLAAACTDVVLANSSWTAAHLHRVWGRVVPVVFPPCKLDMATEDGLRDPGMIVSVGQFRPEKRHGLQLEVMAYLRDHFPGLQFQLVMVGGARNDDDLARARSLREAAARRNLAVEVCVNVSRAELSSALRRASIGIHTMRDEHFGISVVELQAAGLVVVAHRSGGVGMDIVDDGVDGYLADDVKEYAEGVARVGSMDERERESIRRNGRKACSRFGEAVFGRGFANAIAPLGEIAQAKSRANEARGARSSYSAGV